MWDAALQQSAKLLVWFHTTTAYDIVRQCGVEVGKRDYKGKTPAS